MEILFWNSTTGIGVLSGANSYRCIDIDGCSSTEFVKTGLIIFWALKAYMIGLLVLK